jgi:predicted regulator of Ras-like GTPase activity (Roadblock/LC7/MglB family)
MNWLGNFSLRNLFKKFRRRNDEYDALSRQFGRHETEESEPRIFDFPIQKQKAPPIDLPEPENNSPNPPEPVKPPASAVALSEIQLEFTEVPEILRHFILRARADLVILADRNGAPATHGHKPTAPPPSSADLEMMAKLAAGQIAATQKICGLMGEEGQFNSILQEGEQRNIFICHIVPDFILITLVDKSVVVGKVRLQLNETVQNLRKTLEQI